ncbi:MAG: hypothetical protein U0165_07655 [Polyangiaceae bacterium]
MPFVEMFGGRVQGVVSSGSDIERVYVSFIEAKTMNVSCRTNNNRPCGGLRGSSCKHIYEMLGEAVLQFGADHVATYLGLEGDPSSYRSSSDIVPKMRGSIVNVEAGMVFSRFLSYLRYVELPSSTDAIPEMAWFVG